jgi:hypothetical protein
VAIVVISARVPVAPIPITMFVPIPLTMPADDQFGAHDDSRWRVGARCSSTTDGGGGAYPSAGAT